MKLKDLYENYQLKKSDNVVSTKDYTILEYDDCLISIKPIEQIPIKNNVSIAFDITDIETELKTIKHIDKILKNISTNNIGKTKFNMIIDYFQMMMSMELRGNDMNIMIKMHDVFSKNYNFNGYTDWYIPSVNEIPNINQIDNKYNFITMDITSDGKILNHRNGQQSYEYVAIINSLVMRHDK